MSKITKLQALKNGDYFDFMINSNPVCPHCGAICDIHELEWWELFEEDDHTVDCPHCDIEFLVVSKATWRFSTDQQEDD